MIKFAWRYETIFIFSYKEKQAEKKASENANYDIKLRFKVNYIVSSVGY